MSWPAMIGRLPALRRTSVYQEKTDGSNRTLVASPAHAPAWSPGGREIAYITERASSRGRECQVWTRWPNGSHPKRLLSVSGCNPARWTGLAWSPDGRQLVVGDDYVMDANGGRVASLELEHPPPEQWGLFIAPTW